jgi:hypothetical protein
MPVQEERISLSIIFRINTASTNFIAVEEDLLITTDSTNSFGSLDLIIPSHNNYELLIMTLHALMNCNTIYRMNISRDILLLQHHWMEFGKNWGDHIHQAEWTTLICDRFSAPLKRSVIVSLYRKFCISSSIKPEEGIPLPQAIDLLDNTRKLILHMENKIDPCDVIWNIILQYNAKYEEKDVNNSISDESTFRVDRDDKKKKKAKVETVCAAAFLKFLRSQQKISKATIQQVKDLFECLNSISSASDMMDDGITRKEVPQGRTYSRSYISKSVFLNYILSDSNDAFDPIRGKWEQDDMTQPLCSYWINSSHDTYLREVPPTIVDSLFQQNFADCSVNVKMYATALYRGCRSLDLDVWDGELTQKGQPVIKFNSVKYGSIAQNTIPNGAPLSNAEPILFADILWLIRSFLISNPKTLPILLFIENHCCVPNQDQMADDVSNILIADDMVYIPKGRVEDTLPSPHELRGKVVIKFKRAENSSFAVFNDHDEDVDIIPKISIHSDNLICNEEAEIEIQGLETVGSVISDSHHRHKKTLIELEKEAEQEVASAKAIANKADQEAFDAKVKSNLARQKAFELMKKANMSVKEAEIELKRLENKVNMTLPANVSWNVEQTISNQISFDNSDDDNDDKTTETNDQSVKCEKNFLNQIFQWGKQNIYGVPSSESENDASTFDDDESIISGSHSIPEKSNQEFRRYQAAAKKKRENQEKNLDRTVDHAIIRHSEAEKKKMKAAEILSKATEALKKRQKEFDEVNRIFNKAKEKRDKASKDLDFAQIDADEKKKNVQVTEQELASLEAQVQRYSDSLKTATTAAETAAAEALASDGRAKEAEKMVKRAEASKLSATSRAKYETAKEHESEKIVANETKLLNEAERSCKASQSKWKSIVDGLDKLERQIMDIKSNPQFNSEQKANEGNSVDGEGKMSKKLHMKVEQKVLLEDKLRKAARDKEVAEAKQKKSKESLDQAIKECIDQQKKAAAAREEADGIGISAEKYADIIEKENDAANMRREAREKAEAHLQKIEAQLAKAQQDLQNARCVSEEVISNAAKSQAYSEKRKRYAVNLEDLKKYDVMVEAKRKQLRSAKEMYKRAYQANNEAQQNFEEACNVLNKNADISYKAKIEANVQESRIDAKKSLDQQAVSAYDSYKKLEYESEGAKERAAACQLQAAEKAAAYYHAQEYTKKKSLVLPISMKLSDMTLLHSAKFKYFEKSKAMPFNHIHSFAEGMIYQVYGEGQNARENMIKLNKTHITRVFPSKHASLRSDSNNYNPVIAWSLGCQIASLNQQVCDASILINDGLFRVNGSCGYVLKPESMIDRKGGYISRRNSVDANLPRSWMVKILSGYNLPKPCKKALTGTINPQVRVSLYDGGQNLAPTVHVTETVKKNGLNPIWDEKDGIIFKVNDPSTAVILFSLWDVDELDAGEDFIAAAAIPISCMRQGYRSIPLFDANHMRCGAHGNTMLLVRIDAKQ